MRLKELKRFIGFLFLIILFLGLATADSCSIQSSCNIANTVMKLSNALNVHGSLYNQGSYTQYLCCDFTGTHTCDGTNKILGLSVNTNAHAEIPSLTNYGTNVCFGDLECNSGSGSCPSGYNIPMLSLSPNTNAHLGSFNTYSTKICCCAPSDWEWTNNYQCSGDIRQREQRKTVCPSGYEYQWVNYDCSSGQVCVGSGECVDNCRFTNAYWSQSSVEEGTNVEMIVEGTNCDGKSITFEIYEDDFWPLPDASVTSFVVNSLSSTWITEWMDDISGDPEYYFIATLDVYSVITEQSGLLEVTTACGNGIISGDETCDDGNLVSGDGCSSSCSTENGWVCTGEPSSCNTVCGNGIISGDETCDDGNLVSGDGCSDICGLETEAYWTDRYGERIGNVFETGTNVGSTVKMILNNSGLGMQGFVTFEIYEDDLLVDEEIRTIAKGNEIYGTFEAIGYGIITAEWIITQEDYDAANELLFADYDGFVFRINGRESNKLTIWPKDETFWCVDYDQETNCERCDDYNCNAASNSVNKKVFEVFPEMWGDIRCGDTVQEGACSYIVNCECKWVSSSSPYCGSAWEFISDNCSSIGRCFFEEDSTDNCDDGFLTYSWEATWFWDIGNGYSSYSDGPSNDTDDYIFENEKYYYDPGKISEKCVGETNTIPCPAQIQLPFFDWKNFIIAIIMLAIIYFLFNKRKEIKIESYH